jgi:4'-phosphopantetheinyl transferase
MDSARRTGPLTEQDVHVWTIPWPDLADMARAVPLPPEEEARAARFVQEKHRLRYRVVRAVSRILIGRYLDSPPWSLPFEKNAFGKPSIGDNAGLHFGLSYAGNVALVALARQPVGIDIEQHIPLETDDLVGAYFSASEQTEYFRFPHHRRSDSFFHIWTQKEAYLKFRGIGISNGLDFFDVECDPDSAPRLVEDRSLSHHKSPHLPDVRFLPIHAPKGYSAVVATAPVVRLVTEYGFPIG